MKGVSECPGEFQRRVHHSTFNDCKPESTTRWLIPAKQSQYVLTFDIAQKINQGPNPRSFSWVLSLFSQTPWSFFNLLLPAPTVIFLVPVSLQLAFSIKSRNAKMTELQLDGCLRTRFPPTRQANEGKFMKNQTHASLTGFFASVLCLLVSSSAFAAATDCRTLSDTPNLKLQSCNPGVQEQRWMKLTAKNQNASATVVNATFSANHKIWDRVWISEGSTQLSKTTQKALKHLVLQPTPELQKSGFVPLLDVLGNFLKPESRLENFDRRTSQNLRGNRWDENAFGTWTPICEAIGTSHLASFFLKGDGMHVPQLIDLPVGEPETQCRGRCGWGCAQNGLQVRHNQYTQECFNHDACHWIHHEQLGVCADAFWAAAASYAFAPDCPIHSSAQLVR